MAALKSFVKRHSMAVFFVLAYLLSWLAVVPMGGSLLPWGPAVAAFIVLGMTEGRAGVRDLLRQMGRWRVGLGWYLIALSLPLIVSLLAGWLNVLLGATPGRLEPWYSFLAAIPVFLLIGGEWEEPGWTGYALPRLQAGRTALAASLILSVFRTGWHLPLFLYGHITLADIPFIVAAQVIITWLYNSTRRSVLIVMLLHLMMNVNGEYFSALFSGVEADNFAWLRAAVFVVISVIVVLWAGPKRLSRETPAPLEAAKLNP